MVLTGAGSGTAGSHQPTVPTQEDHAHTGGAIHTHAAGSWRQSGRGVNRSPSHAEAGMHSGTAFESAVNRWCQAGCNLMPIVTVYSSCTSATIRLFGTPPATISTSAQAKGGGGNAAVGARPPPAPPRAHTLVPLRDITNGVRQRRGVAGRVPTGFQMDRGSICGRTRPSEPLWLENRQFRLRWPYFRPPSPRPPFAPVFIANSTVKGKRE